MKRERDGNRYRSIFDLVRELREDAALPAGEPLARYLKPDLLIVDDIPAAYTLDRPPQTFLLPRCIAWFAASFIVGPHS